MKVVTSIRDIYEDRKPVYEKLKEDVDQYFLSQKHRNWHYESRIKELQSFTLKAETDRYERISELEDFFGACLVVENISTIKNAIKLINKRYQTLYQRPIRPNLTSKSPDSFVFDDLRLYIQIPLDPTRRAKGIEEVVFEVQIKTFLQHAWSIATHDMVYKGDSINWAYSRIAFQVKAMLEHAELSIMESNNLSRNQFLNKTNKDYKVKNQLIAFLKEKWQPEQLPEDLIRLASNIKSLMETVGINLRDLKEICKESSIFSATPPKNLSPKIAVTLAIIEAIEGIEEIFKSERKKLFIPNEALEFLSAEKKSRIDEIRLIPS